jgi:SsrA-binding protein
LDFAHGAPYAATASPAPAQNSRFLIDATMKIRGNFAVSRQSSHVIAPQDRSGPQKPVRPRDPVASGERDAAQNRAASHNYFLLEKYEAGIALRGTEVKSIREGKANLKDAYGLVKDGEAFLLNVHIGPYSHGNIANHDETRTRKLLMHREEVRKLQSKTQIKGHTLIPTRLYFRKGRVKCELALAKGKQDWDKRETERRREADREARAAINADKHRRGR